MATFVTLKSQALGSAYLTYPQILLCSKFLSWRDRFSLNMLKGYGCFFVTLTHKFPILNRKLYIKSHLLYVFFNYLILFLFILLVSL